MPRRARAVAHDLEYLFQAKRISWQPRLSEEVMSLASTIAVAAAAMAATPKQTAC
jgi:hypothetical protein